ncbi:MAG: hypothetical protein ORN54_12470 [Cyclobacteriaceae bacterium]|nr:hypothetical protein [Cyclobacteriaceae bacterium]
MFYKVMFGFITVVVFGSFTNQYIFQKVSMDMVTKTAVKGMAAKITGSIYYSSEGKMVSYYNEPEPMVVINNRKGDITMYNFRGNTVTQQQNYVFSTETNQLYYFLDNKKADLGLIALGYAVHETRFKDGLKITVWTPPLNLRKEISSVELVHEKANPIYIAYFGQKNVPLKKIYFYNYSQISEYITLPGAVTQINFTTKNDSTIMKTTYTNVKLNQEVDDKKMDFSVPSNAKTLR